jgi:hypothetical protein
MASKENSGPRRLSPVAESKFVAANGWKPV